MDGRSTTTAPGAGGMGNAVRRAMHAWHGRIVTRARTVLCPHRILLAQGEGAGDAVAMASSQGMKEAIAMALADVERWFAAHEGSVCDVALSGAWMLASVMPPHDAEAHGGDARAHALSQWSRYLDIDAVRIEADWVLGTLTVPGVAMVCAAPAALVRGVAGHARAHHVRLVGLRPWWVHAAQRWLTAARDDEGDGARGGSGLITPAHRHRLDLVEPGLVTSLRAIDGPGGRVVDAIWSERVSQDAWRSGDGVAAAKDAQPCRVVLPDADRDERVQPWHGQVRDHAALTPVLMGRVGMDVGMAAMAQAPMQGRQGTVGVPS